MGMISRYLERLAARLQGRSPGPAGVSVDAEGLQVGSHAIAWREIRRVEAFKRDAYVGDCLCLAILGTDDRIVEISEASPGWEEAGEAIERHLPGSMPHAQWMLRLIGSAVGPSVVVHPVA